LKRKDVAFIKKSLAKVKRIVILIHYNPDGDAIGSALALYMFLQQQGHVVDVISPNPFPQFLQWMPQSNKIMPASENIDVCISKISTAELIFCLDFNAPNRIGILQDALKAAKASKIIIDHHIDPTKDFDIYYSVSEGISSTSELMYNFLIHKLGNKKSITKAMA
jgi:phosphoesterase RecJ-like protein